MKEMTKLYKLSAPEWVKEFDNDIDLKAELYSHICDSCRNGCAEDDIVIWEPVNEKSDIGDMLATACGCEYDVDDDVQLFGM